MASRVEDMATIDAALLGEYQTEEPSSIPPPPPLQNLSPEQNTDQPQPEQTPANPAGAVYSSAKEIAGSASGIVRGAGLRLGSIPTPGSIALPLILLLLLMILIIPINGHTRFVWL